MIERMYEYNLSNATELVGDGKVHYTVPSSLLNECNKDNQKKLLVFSYFAITRGLDCRVNLYVSSLVEWCGFKPNNRVGRINDKFIEIVNELRDEGYISFDGLIDRLGFTTVTYNYDFVIDECKNKSFATIYLDELFSIINRGKIKVDDNKKRYISHDTIFYVFVYLRNSIFKRSNKLRITEEKSSLEESISKRRLNMPEAYDDNYSHMSEELNVSSKTISNCVSELNEIGLIVSKDAFRLKTDKDEFRTLTTIFCNAYKRENNYLLDYGTSYSDREIENKVDKINKFYKKKIYVLK